MTPVYLESWRGFSASRKRLRSGSRRRVPRGLYLLDMFPYPSVQGFSVNQLRGIVITDVVARHREALGATVTWYGNWCRWSATGGAEEPRG